MVEEVNIDKLTPAMWDLIRTWDYNTLMTASKMLQPLDEEQYND